MEVMDDRHGMTMVVLLFPSILPSPSGRFV